MRSWLGVPVETLCRKHLLGEHVETHMIAGHLRLGRKLGRYATFYETALIQSRHDELAAEMEARGYQHNSPLFYRDALKAGSVDRAATRAELHRRCAECAERFANFPRNQGDQA